MGVVLRKIFSYKFACQVACLGDLLVAGNRCLI